MPRAGAVVRIGEGRVEVETAEWAACFEGKLADDVGAVATGTVSPRLAA